MKGIASSWKLLRWRGFFFAQAAVVFGCAGLLTAQQQQQQEQKKVAGPPPPAPGTNHRVVVPFVHDPENPALPAPGDARQFYLDYETFDRLWKLAKENRIREATGREMRESGAKDFILTNALYRGEAKRDRIEIEGQLTVHTRGKPWQKVPLPFSQVNISKIELDGAPASYQDNAVLIEEPGLHQITVTFEVPIAEGAESAKWKIPASSATLIALKMDSELAEPVLNNGLPLVKSIDPDDPATTVFTAALGQATAIDFRRRLKTSGRGMTQPNVAVIDSHLFVTPALERLETSFRLEFAGQEENSFSIAFDPSITPVRFEIPNLATWRIVGGGAGQDLRVLEFELTQPVRDVVTVKMVGERLIDDPSVAREFPDLGANAMRLVRYRTILRTDDLDVKVQPGQRHRQSDFRSQGVDIQGFIPVSTHELAGKPEPLAFQLSEQSPERLAFAEYVFQVSAGKIETIGQFQIRSPEAPLLNLSVTLPAGSRIQAVEGTRVKDWWRTGDELFVRFSGDTPEITALLVYVARDFDADASDVAIAPFGLPGFDDEKVDGAGIVVAHVTRDTLLRFDQSRQVVREVGPNEAANDFEVLAPLQRKRAFRFERAAFSGTVSLSPIEPRFDSSWVMLSQAHESWQNVSIHADVEVTRSAIDRVVFSTAESVPEFRVLSPEVREVRTAVSDGRREYTLIFQHFVTDAIAFTLEAEIPHNGTAELPDVEFSGATRQERYVIVENQSRDRIDLDSSGLDTTVVDLLPFKPDTLKSAQLFRARPGWNATVTIEKLETSAGNEAVVPYAELSTAFRANGEEWVRAIYHLQNRSLQFLPVALPENAELVAVSVAGQEVRADSGVIDGQKVVLVPLIQTRPGMLAYDVELVFRSRDAVGDSSDRLTSFSRTLDDPELVGLTVEKTLWSIYLPAEHDLTNADGNMTRVERTANVIEKLQADLTELEQLNRLGASENIDFQTLSMACSNGDLIANRIEMTLNQIESPEVTQIKQELEKQKVIITENRIEMPKFQQREIAQNRANVAGDAESRYNWFDNSTEIVTRNKKIESKNFAQIQKVEKQVRLNDNVSIGNQFFNNGMVVPQAPSVDPFASTPQNQPQQPPQQKKGKAAAAKRAQIGKLAEGEESMAVEEKLRSLNYQQLGHGGKESGKPAGEKDQGRYIDLGGKKAAPAQPQVQAPASKSSFGINARQQLNRDEAQVQRRGQQQQLEMPMQTARPQAGERLQGQTVQRTFGAGGTVGNQIDQVSPNDFSFTQPGEPLGDAFRAGGRRSVAVSFPVDGNVYHFQKLKDHAEIEIESEQPADLARGKWLLGFVICCALLFAGDRLARRFVGRRAETA